MKLRAIRYDRMAEEPFVLSFVSFVMGYFVVDQDFFLGNIFIPLFWIGSIITILLFLLTYIHRKRNEYICSKGVEIDAEYIDCKMYRGKYSYINTYMKLNIEYSIKGQRKYIFKSIGYHCKNIKPLSKCKLVIYKNKIYLNENSMQFYE